MRLHISIRCPTVVLPADVQRRIYDLLEPYKLICASRTGDGIDYHATIDVGDDVVPAAAYSLPDPYLED